VKLQTPRVVELADPVFDSGEIIYI